MGRCVLGSHRLFRIGFHSYVQSSDTSPLSSAIYLSILRDRTHWSISYLNLSTSCPNWGLKRAEWDLVSGRSGGAIHYIGSHCWSVKQGFCQDMIMNNLEKEDQLSEEEIMFNAVHAWAGARCAKIHYIAISFWCVGVSDTQFNTLWMFVKVSVRRDTWYRANIFK